MSKNKLFSILFFSFFLLPLFHTNADITTGLVSHWKLDETTGTVADDFVGVNNGALTNGPLWTAGKIGGSLNFDGANDYVSIPNMNYDEVSVSTWFYRNSVDTSAPDFVFGGSSWNGGGQGYGLYFSENSGSRDTIQFVVTSRPSNGAKTQKYASANLVTSTGQWFHVVGTYNKTNGQQKLYVNGVNVYTQTHTPGNTIVPYTTQSYMGIGTVTSNYGNFNGKIDDVRIYNRALGPQDVADLYLLGNPSSSSSVSSFSGTFDPPQNLGAEAYCTPEVLIYWTAPNDGVVNYKIEKLDGVQTSTYNTTATNYTDNSVSMDTYYIYDVTAEYQNGESVPMSILLKTPTNADCQADPVRESQVCPYTEDLNQKKYVITFRSFLGRGTPSGVPVNKSMPAGIYKVSLASFDGYLNRVNIFQPNEQWYASLRNSSGNEIVKTSTISDLADFVKYAYKNEITDETLAVPGCVESAQTIWDGWSHQFSYGSVYAICGYFEKLDSINPGNQCQLAPVSNLSVTFTATPNVIDNGESSTLSWSSTDALSCSASGGWSGAKSTSGSESTGPLTGTTSYILTCVDALGNSDTKSVTVTVNELNSINCSASVPIINIGQEVDWQVSVSPPGSYSYSWSGDDGLFGTSDMVTKKYLTTGIKNGVVSVTGGSQPSLCTAIVKVRANPLFDEY